MLFLGSNTVSASTTQPKDQELYSQLDDTTKSQLAELDKYLVDVDGIKFFDYDKAESSGASDAILTMGAENNVWAQDIKYYGLKSGEKIAMARINMLVYGNYCGKGNNGKKPIDDLDSACKSHDACYVWGGNNTKCNHNFGLKLLPIIQRSNALSYKHLVATTAFSIFCG